MTQLAWSTPPRLSRRSRLLQAWIAHHGPTWLVLGVVTGGWLWLSIAGGDWPAWLVVLVGAPLLCWYGSLQHELIHGHLLTGSRWNERLASAPLSLWLPYALYRDSHLAHHAAPRLADPLADPESFYVSPAHWARLAPAMRALLVVNNTLLGRMLIGPLLQIGGFWRAEWRQCRVDRAHRRLWAWHLLAVALVLAWLQLWGFPLWRYALLVVWPGTGLLLVRSFYEHRPAGTLPAASVVVEAALPWRWLFLNNNYHVLHHRDPQLPWYRLHRQYQREREALLRANQGFYFTGYGQWFRRFGWRVKDHPRFPSGMITAETLPGTANQQRE